MALVHEVKDFINICLHYLLLFFSKYGPMQMLTHLVYLIYTQAYELDLLFLKNLLLQMRFIEFDTGPQ